MKKLPGSFREDLQNIIILTKSQKTLRDYIRKNELWFFLFGHKRLIVISNFGYSFGFKIKL